MGTGKNRSEDNCNVLYSPGQTVHADLSLQDKLRQAARVVLGRGDAAAASPGGAGERPQQSARLRQLSHAGEGRLDLLHDQRERDARSDQGGQLPRAGAAEELRRGRAHELELFLVANAAGGGSRVALVDGELVVNYSGPVGIGLRQFYPKDGGDDQVRAVSVRGFTITAIGP